MKFYRFVSNVGFSPVGSKLHRFIDGSFYREMYNWSWREQFQIICNSQLGYRYFIRLDISLRIKVNYTGKFSVI